MLINNKSLGSNSAVLETHTESIEKLEKDRQAKADVQTDKLVKSISALTKTLLNVEKNAVRDKVGGHPQIKNLISNSVSNVKNLTTGAGFFGKMAERSSSPIMGSIFGSLANRYEKKDAEREKVHSFVKTVAVGTKYGRDLTEQLGAKGAAEKLKEDYKKQSMLETKIYAKKAMQKDIKDRGTAIGIETDLPEQELKKLHELEDELSKEKEKYKAAVEKKESSKESSKDTITAENFETVKTEFLDAITAGMKEEYDTLPDNEKQLLKDQDPEFFKGLEDGIFKELQQVQQEQLEQLIRIADSVDVDREAQLEAKREQMIPDNAKESESKDEKKQFIQQILDGFGTKFKSLFNLKSLVSVFKNIGGGISTLIRSIGPLVSGIGALFGQLMPVIQSIGSALAGLAPILGPIAAVAGAGAVGAGVGMAINSGVEALTGDTVGNHIYDGAQSLKKMFGFETDEDKANAADKKQIEELVGKKKTAGESITPWLAEQAKKHNIDIKGVSVVDTKSSNNQTNKETNSIRDTNKETNSSELVHKSDSSNTTDLIRDTNKETNSSELVHKSDSSNTTDLIRKAEQNSHILSKTIERDADAIETKHVAPAQVSAPVVVNAPTTNNNTTQNIVRPALRNSDPQLLYTNQRRLAY